MQILGLGTDIVEVKRIEKAINKTSGFVTKVFTSKEIEYCESKPNKYERYAGRFCAKEAVSKALGTGVRDFKLCDIEINNDSLGKPEVILHGTLESKRNNIEIHLTISHCKEYGTATAIIISK